jgi:YHS domain-containing protein
MIKTADQKPPEVPITHCSSFKENPMLNHLKSVIYVSVAALLIHNTTFAADEYNVSTGITAAGVPLGVHGVDSVALSTLGAVAEGEALHTVVHDGIAYYFASKSSAGKFESNPNKYLPQYGGFCAYAVALGKKFDGDPNFADIVDGKLYLFVNDAIFQKYKADQHNILANAAKMWPKIQSKAVSDL